MCANCGSKNETAKITQEWRDWYLYGQYEEARKARETKKQNTEVQQPEALAEPQQDSVNPKETYWTILDEKGIKYKKTQSVQTLIELINANS